MGPGCAHPCPELPVTTTTRGSRGSGGPALHPGCSPAQLCASAAPAWRGGARGPGRRAAGCTADQQKQESRWLQKPRGKSGTSVGGGQGGHGLPAQGLLPAAGGCNRDQPSGHIHPVAKVPSFWNHLPLRPGAGRPWALVSSPTGPEDKSCRTRSNCSLCWARLRCSCAPPQRGHL